jgi:hypothetical protein
MAEVTYYVAMPFLAGDDGIVAGETTECFNPVAVVMRAEAFSREQGHIGAVAFSRTGETCDRRFRRREGDQEVRRGARRSRRVVTGAGDDGWRRNPVRACPALD